MTDSETMLQQLLDDVQARWPQVDVRPGSIIYCTLAPVSVLLAQQQFYMDNDLDARMPDTAQGSDLDRVMKDFGLTRIAATKALREGTFTAQDGSPAELTLGVRFGADNMVYRVTECVAAGDYKLECDTPGTIGNLYSGPLLPVDNVNGLGDATLLPTALIPARDTETDDEFRTRFYNRTRHVRYGGNIADYEDMALSVEGVGAVRVFNATVMGAGSVGLVVGDAQGNTATSELVARVQAVMGADGGGLAPIGHTVIVKTSEDLTVNVAVTVRLQEGVSLELVQPAVEQTVSNYIDSVGFQDGTLFKAKLEALILGCDARIVDIQPVALNAAEQNLYLSKTYDSYQVPVCGTITVREAGA